MTSDTYFILPRAKSSINNLEHVSQCYGFLSWGLKFYLLIITKEGKAFPSAVGTDEEKCIDIKGEIFSVTVLATGASQ